VGDCYINKQGQTECVVGMTGGRLQEQPNVDDYHSLDYPKQKESHGLTYVKDDGTEFKYGLDMDWSRCNVM
jgi:2-hydroxychromene-2-carboxylate isomerase